MMTGKRYVLQLLTASGLALMVLILTMTIPALIQGDANITIVKESDQVVAKDSQATFVMTVTNTSGVTLTDVVVTDSECTVTGPDGDTHNPGELDTDETWIYTCSPSVSQSFTNIATVNGKRGDDQTPVTDNDSATVTVADIDVEKSTNTPVVASDSNVDFTITVDNTGDADLNSVDIDDDPGCDVLSPPSGDTSNVGVLDTDETWTYTCTINVTADFTNVATATANAVVAPAIQVEDSGQAAVDVVNPGIDVEKTPETQTVSTGNSANFTITVDNTGDVDLTSVTVVDTKCGSLSNPTGDTGNDDILGTDETWTYSTCSVSNVQEGFINSVTVNATSPAGGASDSDAAQVILTEVAQACPVQGQTTVDMTAYWKLDEQDNGASGYDDFYSGHDGVCAAGKSCPTSQLEGRVGGAQTFNGTNTGIDIPVIPGDDSFNWGANDSFSIELWMKSSSGACTGPDYQSNEVIIGRDDSSTNLHWWLGCRYTGIAHFGVIDVDNVTAFVGGPVINDGAWHHLVGVHDGNEDEIRLYVDGELLPGATADMNSTGGFGSDSAALNIGWLNTGFGSSGFHFAGETDEVAVYNRVLSETEIGQHYNNGQPGPGHCGAPTITSTPVVTANLGQEYAYNVDAVGTPPPTYTLTIFPTGMTIDSNTGEISWIPTIKGNYNVRVRASNWLGEAFQEFIISAGAIAPDITSTPVTEATVGVPYTYDVEALGNPVPTYSLTQAPTGMTIDPNTGQISWTPAPGQVGDHNVNVRASNSEGTDDQPFTIKVSGSGTGTSIYLPLILK